MIAKVFFILITALAPIYGNVKEYPQNVNGKSVSVRETEDHDFDYYEAFNCDGYHFFEAKVSTIQENCGSVPIEGSTRIVNRDCSNQPEGFYSTEDGNLLAMFCLDDALRLGLSSTEEGDPMLITEGADKTAKITTYCQLVSYQESPNNGCYMAKLVFWLRMYESGTWKYCPLGIVDNVLTFFPQYCATTYDNPIQDLPEELIVSVEAVRYFYLRDEYNPSYWSGVFSLCASDDCKERVRFVNVGGEQVALRSLLLLAHIFL